MHTLKLIIPADTVKALLLSAGDGDIRYYLNGVLLDLSTPGRAHLVSTDGHRLTALNLDQDVAIETENLDAWRDWKCGGNPGQYIIPRETLEAVKPKKTGKIVFPLIVTITRTPDIPDPERPGVTIQGTFALTVEGQTTAAGVPIDGQFPDWKRILPRQVSGEVAQFNGDYVADCTKAAQLLNESKEAFATIAHNGNGPALINLSADAFGVLMPMLATAPPSVLPHWLDAPADADADADANPEAA
jgi:DNA polymerase III subunit beta